MLFESLLNSYTLLRLVAVCAPLKILAVILISIVIFPKE